MTLLEIGCGWGLTLQRAMEKYDVNVIGLTLSKNQQAYCDQLLSKIDSNRTFDVRLEGWEQFHSPVDRIVSIEAFEHFGFERYDDFFKTCFDILPDDGRMTIQSSVGYHPYDLAERGKKLTFELARFIKFMITEIFPGGRIPTTQMMVEHGEKAGFVVPETLSLRNHYIKTLGIWAEPARGAQGRGDRGHRRGELPPLHEVPDGLPSTTSSTRAIDVSLVTYLKPGARRIGSEDTDSKPPARARGFCFWIQATARRVAVARFRASGEIAHRVVIACRGIQPYVQSGANGLSGRGLTGTPALSDRRSRRVRSNVAGPGSAFAIPTRPSRLSGVQPSPTRARPAVSAASARLAQR